jgi:transcriptional regulator with XRE-family HTH domain
MPTVNTYDGGSFLKSKRIIAGLTLQAAGERVKPPIPAGQLSKLEKGHVERFDFTQLPRLALVYGVGIDAILDAYGVQASQEPAPDPAEEMALRLGRMVVALPDADRHNVMCRVVALQHSPLSTLGQE